MIMIVNKVLKRYVCNCGYLNIFSNLLHCDNLSTHLYCAYSQKITTINTVINKLLTFWRKRKRVIEKKEEATNKNE